MKFKTAFTLLCIRRIFNIWPCCPKYAQTCRRWWCPLPSIPQSFPLWGRGWRQEPAPPPSGWSLKAPHGPRLQPDRTDQTLRWGFKRKWIYQYASSSSCVKPSWTAVAWKVTCGQRNVDPLLQPSPQRLVDVPGEVCGSEHHHHFRGVIVFQGSANTWKTHRITNEHQSSSNSDSIKAHIVAGFILWILFFFFFGRSTQSAATTHNTSPLWSTNRPSESEVLI